MLVFYEYYRFDASDEKKPVILLACAVAVATAIYFFVEQPFRRGPSSRRERDKRLGSDRTFLLGSLGSMAAVTSLGIWIGVDGGWTWRQPGAFTPAQVQAGMTRRFQLLARGCSILRADDPQFCHRERLVQVLVFGDSHEVDGYNAFHAIYGNSADVNLIYFGTSNRCEYEVSGGRPVSSVASRGCQERFERLASPDFIREIDFVVYSANNPFFEKKRQDWRLLKSLKAQNRRLRVLVMGGYLNTTRNCSEIFDRTGSLSECKATRFVASWPKDERASTTIEDARELDYLYIDKMRMLCPTGTVESCAIEAGGEPAFYDRHHLSFGFATFLGQLVASSYGETLEAMGLPEASRPEYGRLMRGP